MIHDLQSEVSGDYGKALLILAEVLYITVKQSHGTATDSQQMSQLLKCAKKVNLHVEEKNIHICDLELQLKITLTSLRLNIVI